MHRVEMHACCHGKNFCMHIVIWVVGMLVPVAHGCGDMCRKKSMLILHRVTKKVFSRMPMGDTWDDAESAIYFFNSSGTKKT